MRHIPISLNIHDDYIPGKNDMSHKRFLAFSLAALGLGLTSPVSGEETRNWQEAFADAAYLEAWLNNTPPDDFPPRICRDVYESDAGIILHIPWPT